jgi:hypothetical protein
MCGARVRGTAMQLHMRASKEVLARGGVAAHPKQTPCSSSINSTAHGVRDTAGSSQYSHSRSA